MRLLTVSCAAAAILLGCDALGPGVPRDDPGGVCAAQWAVRYGVSSQGDTASTCLPRDVVVERAPGSDCHGHQAFGVSGCWFEDGEPATDTLWINIDDGTCHVLDSVAGICFE